MIEQTHDEGPWHKYSEEDGLTDLTTGVFRMIVHRTVEPSSTVPGRYPADARTPFDNRFRSSEERGCPSGVRGVSTH
jgi:hypothetical protein